MSVHLITHIQRRSKVRLILLHCCQNIILHYSNFCHIKMTAGKKCLQFKYYILIICARNNLIRGSCNLVLLGIHILSADRL